MIKYVEDMQIWQKSEAYFDYFDFIVDLNNAVKGKSNYLNGIEPSENVQKVIWLLDQLDKMIDKTPALNEPQRFGNQAFRTWCEKLNDNGSTLLCDVLPLKLHPAIPEIVVYLTEGFGNSIRIDYGTGHETAFVMFLYCLFKIGVLRKKDKETVPCKIFTRYLDVVRKLQRTYRMEPAGSHGVWSLDDHQVLPFIWGSSQLIAHPYIRPASFLEPEIVDAYADDYMFLRCIQHINRVKTGPFSEHSNQLWGISAVPSWSQINEGLLKMYKVEVLGKFPVVQHMVFGSLLPLKPADLSTRQNLMTPPVKLSEDQINSNGNSQSSGTESSENGSSVVSLGSYNWEISSNDTVKQD